MARERAKQDLQRRQWGPPAHEGTTCELVAPERVDAPLIILPAGAGAGHRFTGEEEQVGDPVAHQKWKLSAIASLVV